MPTPFTVRLDEATLNALDDLAEKTDRSRNWLVSRAVEDFIALNAEMAPQCPVITEKKEPLVKEGE